MSEWSPVARALEALVQSPHWSREQLGAFQSRCLRHLVRHAGRRVPFYRDLFRRVGVEPDAVRGIEDLHCLPIVTRSELQESSVAARVAAGLDPSRLVHHRTGGSSGVPLTIRRTLFEERLLQSLRLLAFVGWGLRPTDLRVFLGLRAHPGRVCISPEWYTRLGWFRWRGVNCLLPAVDILSAVAELDPDVLLGYPDSLAWIASEPLWPGTGRIRPRFIASSGETLTPDMRRQITERFGAPLYDSYAAHEFNPIAEQCRETGLYHLSENSVLVEVLRDGRSVGPGESGELVGTALHSFAMPFLRYRLGDWVTRGPARCPCGAPCATLESIQGRVMDRFPLPGGRFLHPYELAYALVHVATWIRRYQIVQSEVGHITFQLIVMPGYVPTGDDWRRLRSSLEPTLGPAVRCTFELVDELPPTESGKFRPYRALVSMPAT